MHKKQKKINNTNHLKLVGESILPENLYSTQHTNGFKNPIVYRNISNSKQRNSKQKNQKGICRSGKGVKREQLSKTSTGMRKEIVKQKYQKMHKKYMHQSYVKNNNIPFMQEKAQSLENKRNKHPIFSKFTQLELYNKSRKSQKSDSLNKRTIEFNDCFAYQHKCIPFLIEPYQSFRGTKRKSFQTQTSKFSQIQKHQENSTIKLRKRLTEYEINQIKELRPKIFYGSNLNFKILNKTQGNNNYGFDDQQGDYIIRLKDHIAYRFQILKILGKGSFGVVVKVFDHKFKKIQAIKIIRNRLKYHKQALLQIRILCQIKESDHFGQANVVKLLQSFQFRNHKVVISNQCLMFQLLSMNLYQFIKVNYFKGFSLDLIRRFCIQILNTLSFIAKKGIIHCDLKPQNILLKHQNKSGIKIIDFGSGCYQQQPRNYTYIQSRFYRAPETILGLHYKKEIDMWSLGCILAQLYTGFPLFPGENQEEQVQMFMEVLNTPPQIMLKKSPRREKFFTQQLNPRIIPNSKGKIRSPGAKQINYYLNCDQQNFVDMITKCLIWQPQKRLKPQQGLVHPWIVQGLPEQVRGQYLKQLDIMN